MKKEEMNEMEEFEEFENDEIINDEVDDEETVIREPKKENVLKRGIKKITSGIKKHPKITAAIALALVGGVSYAFGVKMRNGKEVIPLDGDTDDIPEIGYDENDEIETYDFDDSDTEETEDFELAEESEEEAV